MKLRSSSRTEADSTTTCPNTPSGMNANETPAVTPPTEAASSTSPGTTSSVFPSTGTGLTSTVFPLPVAPNANAPPNVFTSTVATSTVLPVPGAPSANAPPNVPTEAATAEPASAEVSTAERATIEAPTAESTTVEAPRTLDQMYADINEAAETPGAAFAKGTTANSPSYTVKRKKVIDDFLAGLWKQAPKYNIYLKKTQDNVPSFIQQGK